MRQTDRYPELEKYTYAAYRPQVGLNKDKKQSLTE